jgi:PIN domain nuclease of toxin-antitoxin system
VIVLDTHAWVWWVADPGRLPEPARRVIQKSLDRGEPLRVSSISAWEVAMLCAHGRLELTMDVAAWIALSEAAPEIEFVPLDNRIAVRAVRLTDFPWRDPADRMIAATALEARASLVTADERMQAYAPLETVWA